jgi:hypothetical protein
MSLVSSEWTEVEARLRAPVKAVEFELKEKGVELEDEVLGNSCDE